MILRTPIGDVERRDASVGAVLAASDQLRGFSPSGVTVSGRTMVGIPAAKLAIQIAAEAVAKRKKLKVWRGEGPSRMPVEATWQARFFAGVPNERDSWMRVLEMTEASLTGRNNAVWLKSKDVANRVAAVYVISPDNVETRWNTDLQQPEYRIMDTNQHRLSDWMGPDQILHFRAGHLDPGCLWAPSPVEIFKTTLRASLARSRFEGEVYDKGLMQKVAVTFPKEIKIEQARRFRELMTAEHGGVGNASSVAVFGGGATVDTIGLSLSDAQFIEAMHLDVQQCARIFNVTGSKLGADSGQASKTAPLPELEEARWNGDGLEPRLARIEEHILADPDFFGPSARDYPAFAPVIIRGDVATEAARVVSLVQAGIFTPDEGRAEMGYPPHAGGLGEIPQITPVGGAPNPDPLPGLVAQQKSEGT